MTLCIGYTCETQKYRKRTRGLHESQEVLRKRSDRVWQSESGTRSSEQPTKSVLGNEKQPFTYRRVSRARRDLVAERIRSSRDLGQLLRLRSTQCVKRAIFRSSEQRELRFAHLRLGKFHCTFVYRIAKGPRSRSGQEQTRT